MEHLANETMKEYGFWRHKGYDDLIDNWALMGSPFPIVSVMVAYLLVVLKIGPDYMKNRPPFVLKNLILLYNVAQVAVSTFIFVTGFQLLLKQGLFDSVCELDKKNLLPIAAATYYYFAAKVSELLDTIFFVLRKKDNQVSFLHVYHHALMLGISWFTLKYEPNYTVVFLGTLNCFVHIVMYSYYALSTFPALTKYLWWKKYITTLQLVQFGLIIIQVSVNTYVSGCPPSRFLLTMIMFNAFLMIYLFSDFYFKAYNEKNNNEIKEKTSKKNALNTQKSELKFANGINRNHKKKHEKSH